MNAQSHSALDNLRSLSFWDGWGCTITVLLLPWLTPTPSKPRVIKRDGMRESAIKLSMEKAALQWRANNTKKQELLFESPTCSQFQGVKYFHFWQSCSHKYTKGSL